MSTKNQTSTQGTFNQAGMNAYNSMQPGLSSTLNSYINNPFSNPFFQTQQQMGTNQANMMGSQAMQGITNNLNMSGINQNSPAALEMINNQRRQNSSNQANLGFLAPMQNAQQMQQSALSMANQYRPLQTGQTGTQSQSGLGSWLPQVAGAGLSMLTGPLGKAMGIGGSAGSYGNSFMQPNNYAGMAGTGGGGYNMSGAPSGGYNMQPSPFAQQQSPSVG